MGGLSGGADEGKQQEVRGGACAGRKGRPSGGGAVKIRAYQSQRLGDLLRHLVVGAEHQTQVVLQGGQDPLGLGRQP